MKQKVYNAAGKAYRFSNSWTGTIIIVLFIIFFVAQAFRIPSGSMKDSLLVGDHLFAKKFAYGIPTPHIPFLEIPVIPGTDGHIYNGDTPERGDIVIFRYPHNTNLHYVKRCVALPGDELFVKHKDLYIHPAEGNEYIRQNYPNNKIIDINGKLWVKQPYQDLHPGIHHDTKYDEMNMDSPIIVSMDSNGQVRTTPISPYEYSKIKNGELIIQRGTVLENNPIFNFKTVKVEKGHYFMMGDNRDHSNDSRFWGPVPYGLVEGTPWFVYFSMDDNYTIRWDRLGKTPVDLEQSEHLDRAVQERIEQDKNDHGLY